MTVLSKDMFIKHKKKKIIIIKYKQIINVQKNKKQKERKQ